MTSNAFPCPVCGNSEHDTLFPEYQGPIVSSDSQTVDRDLRLDNRLCKECGLIFNGTGIRDFSEEFYANSYELMLHSKEMEISNYEGGTQQSQAKRSGELFMEMVKPAPQGVMLEAGAGKGFFLKHLSGLLDGWEVQAFEPGKAFEYCRENVAASRLERCAYDQWHAEAGTYDAIVALGVLEHVNNPLDMLCWASGLLKNDGALFIRVPNFAANPNDLFCADHLSKVTVPTLHDLAARAGLAVNQYADQGVPLFAVLRKTDAPVNVSSAYHENRDIALKNSDLAEKTMGTVERAMHSARDKGEAFGFFGLSLASIFAPYYNGFNPEAIAAYVDENTSFWGMNVHGRPVGGLNLIDELGIRHLALVISPVYHDKVIEKLADYDVTVYTPTGEFGHE